MKTGDEILGLTPAQWAGVAAGVVAVTLPLVANATGHSFYIGFASRVLIVAIAVSSLNLLAGYGAMVSFGHAAYFGMGAYAVLMVSQMAGPLLPVWARTMWVAWPLAMLAAALLALLVGLVSIRVSKVYFIMITLAFGQMVYYLAVGLETFGGDNGMPLPGRAPTGISGLTLSNETHLYYVVLVLCVLAHLGLYRLVYSRFGVILRGVAVNDERMQAIGYPIERYKLAAFVIAGAFAGLAGALMAEQNAYVTPHFLEWMMSGELLVTVLLGGAGHVLGGIYGTVVMLGLKELLSTHTPYWHAVIGVLIIVLVSFGNNGIAGLERQWRMWRDEREFRLSRRLGKQRKHGAAT
jgi:branched-chain amino acid transport system permease protein